MVDSYQNKTILCTNNLFVFFIFCRHYCVNTPEILPKLLLSVKWNSRDEVAQVTKNIGEVLSFEEV